MAQLGGPLKGDPVEALAKAVYEFLEYDALPAFGVDGEALRNDAEGVEACRVFARHILPQLGVTDQDRYYLRSVERQLREFAEALDVGSENVALVGNEVLHDNLDWLNDFIERCGAKPNT